MLSFKTLQYRPITQHRIQLTWGAFRVACLTHLQSQGEVLPFQSLGHITRSNRARTGHVQPGPGLEATPGEEGPEKNCHLTTCTRVRPVTPPLSPVAPTGQSPTGFK